MSTNKLKLQDRTEKLCPMQQSRLEKQKVKSNNWTPIWSSDGDGNRYEVQNCQQKMDVDLSVRTCTCRFWQLTGMPCAHAIAAIAYKNHKAEDYCSGWLTLGAYKASYNYFIQPTEGQEYWTHTEHEKPVPPPCRRRQGRPKRQRRKDSNEAHVSRTKLKRKYPEITCSRCGTEGHNIKGCGNVGVPTRPKKWKSPIVETAHVGGQNEIDASSSQPTTEPATQEYVEHAPHPIAPPSTQVNVEHAPHPTVEPAAQVVDSDGTFQFGFGLATFEALPTGVRPPPIRAPPNMYRVPFPGETSSVGQGFMTFMPTPRGPN
ncbi:hypothetical protein QL285_045383 [Trifolium repens]|nr:hypothetical protein QL285_045383 [Trifolium repens]